MQSRARAAARRWGWAWCAAVLALAVPIHAAAISVSASVESTDIAVGEPFLLTIVVDGAQNVPVPVVQANGFRSDYIGPSTQVSFVNGKMTASVTHRYRMIADEAGQFTLGPFIVGYEDQRYETKPIAMKVRAAGARPQGGAAAPGGEQGLRLILKPERSEVFVGQPVPITLTLYVADSVPARSVRPPNLSADGATIDKPGEGKQGTGVLDGRRYTTVSLPVSLTPVRPGPLEVQASMGVEVMTRRRGLDAIFAMPGDTKLVDVRAEPLPLSVLPLPAEGRPADFTGTVGNYQFELSAKPTSLQAGDPITLRMEIAGSGNLAAVTPPQVAAGPSFRRYDAQPVQGDDGQDRRVFEQVIIPNSPDVHEIPPLQFSYFDPDARAYRTITRGPIPIQVAAAAPNRAAVVDAALAPQPTPVAEAPLGRDIVYIKEAPGAFHARGAAWRLLWWAALALPVAVFAALRSWVRRRDRLAGDPRLVRFRAAGREAQRALAAARSLEARARLDATNAALATYLAAKLDLPPGAVERDRVLERLVAGGVAEPARAEVARFFALAEEARYAGGAGVADGVADAGERIVAALERERGLEGRLGAWLAVLLSAALLAAAVRAAEPPEGGFFAGNQAYAAGDYDAAIASYQQARSNSGLDSGALEFNLGNAFMKKGDIGRAIASYTRAARLLPRDPDVAANLEFARERANLEPELAPIWQRLIAPFAERATDAELATAFAVLWWIFWLLLAARLLWPAARPALARAVAAVAVLALIVGVSLVVRATAVAAAGAAVVVAGGDTPVRFEPTANGTEHFVVTPGVPVTVREERDGWLLVARADGRRGWVPAGAVERID